jgi:hypothetical protein
LDHFTAHRLRFVTEVQDTIELNEHQGSAIRGALFHALRDRFCGNKEAGECAVCPLVATCPVATLVSTLKTESPRGRDVPRPYTIQPPVRGEGWRMKDGGALHSPFSVLPGERFEFGLTLYAQALQLFPYVVLAAKAFEQRGIGRCMEREDGRWRRGTLAIREIWAENPLTGERQPVLAGGDDRVQVPDIPITHRQIMEDGGWRMEKAGDSPILHSPSCILRFLTPTRIVEHGHLVKPEAFCFRPFFQRLMERLESLSRDFSDTPLVFDDPRGLIEAAGRVRVVENRLVWEELRSYSTRRRRSTPTGGLLGTVVLEADDWSPFWPWLVWGQFVHVGKDAVKGNGMYRIEWRMEDGG